MLRVSYTEHEGRWSWSITATDEAKAVCLATSNETYPNLKAAKNGLICKFEQIIDEMKEDINGTEV